MRLEPVVAAGRNSSDQVHYTTGVAVTLVDEALADRVISELVDCGGLIFGWVGDRRMVAYLECSVGRPRTVDKTSQRSVQHVTAMSRAGGAQPVNSCSRHNWCSTAPIRADVPGAKQREIDGSAADIHNRHDVSQPVAFRTSVVCRSRVDRQGGIIRRALTGGHLPTRPSHSRACDSN
jgi:hypothetical protein